MSGHSKFKTIMHRKGAQDAKRSRLFTKVGRELVVAARSGPIDPAFNARLRMAIAAAKAANMPKDRIDRAIKRVSEDDAQYEEMRYEGYGPGGVAILIEALTDNRNRTASDLRSIFNKNSGALAESGAVSFLFQRVGALAYPAEVATADEMLDAAIEAGADDVESDDERHEVTCRPESYAEVRDAIEKRFGAPESGGLTWKPSTTVPVEAEAAESVLRLIDALEDSDDVQAVSANAEISDSEAARLRAQAS